MDKPNKMDDLLNDDKPLKMAKLLNDAKPLIFVDWDNTLFPTEWVQTSNIDMEKPCENTITMFADLDKLITDMIINMVLEGQVLIVTNGSIGWINLCLNLLPNFKQIKDHDAITITSARDLFDKDYSSGDWKKIAFKLFFNEHISDKEGIWRILSFGDSEDEHQAVTELKNHNVIENQQRIIGSVKFIRYPSLNQLVNQIEIVKLLYKEIINLESDHIFELEQFIL